VLFCVLNVPWLRVYYGLRPFLNKLSNALVSRKLCERHTCNMRFWQIFAKICIRQEHAQCCAPSSLKKFSALQKVNYFHEIF
jgi:hypothetical protein